MSAERRDVKPLSPRQEQVLALVGDGLPTREIAEELHLSIDTVRTHRERILKKTGAKNMANAYYLVYRERK